MISDLRELYNTSLGDIARELVRQREIRIMREFLEKFDPSYAPIVIKIKAIRVRPSDGTPIKIFTDIPIHFVPVKSVLK